MHDSRLGGEHLGQPDFLIVTQMEIGGWQRASLWQAMPQDEERWDSIEGGVSAYPGG